MKSLSVENQSQSQSANDQPFGRTIILFNFNGEPKLGTRPIKPGGTFIFTTSQFPVAESLKIEGKTPFIGNDFFTNTPIQIIDTIDPDQNPYLFLVSFKGTQQEICFQLSPTGVDAGELQWDERASRESNWRSVLRVNGEEETIHFFKELPLDSPYRDYVFLIFNPSTREFINVIPVPDGARADVPFGRYIVFAVPPRYSDVRDIDTLMQVGGTDAADLIITPGGLA